MITDKVLAWVRPATDADQSRNQYPFDEPLLVMDQWIAYLGDMSLDVSTQNIYILAMSRFVAMLETDDGAVISMDGLLVNAFNSDIMGELLRLPILSSARSHAHVVYAHNLDDSDDTHHTNHLII